MHCSLSSGDAHDRHCRESCAGLLQYAADAALVCNMWWVLWATCHGAYVEGDTANGEQGINVRTATQSCVNGCVVVE